MVKQILKSRDDRAAENKSTKGKVPLEPDTEKDLRAKEKASVDALISTSGNSDVSDNLSAMYDLCGEFTPLLS